MQNISSIYPMDPDVLLIWEEQLKKREKELKKKGDLMGIFLHDMSHYVNCLYSISYRLRLDDKDSDCKKHCNVYEKEIRNLLDHLRIGFKTFQFYFNPEFFKHELFGPQDIHSIVSRICSSYSVIADRKKIKIRIDNNLTTENMPCLFSSFELAVAMIVDSAIIEAPDNSDFTISFYEVEERLNVEFKSWGRCNDGENPVYWYRREFGSGIIRNPEDKYVALTLFKQICDDNDIVYNFSKGDEKKEFDNENCQSYVVNLTFNSKQQ